MSDENKLEMVKFDETCVLRVNIRDASLPIDTAREWTKGFALVNLLIYELSKERYVERFEDSGGVFRNRTRFNPLLLPLIKERRALMDQIWKISGGEAINEARKELTKSFAKGLFEHKRDKEENEKYKEEAFKIIKAELDEHEENKASSD